MSRQRASLAFTLGLAGAAAATAWFTLLSWRTFTGLLLGSVSAGALHHSRCPVVVVPSMPMDPSLAHST